MRAPLDRALFPQSLLRFLSSGERMGASPHRMIDMFLAAFDVQGQRRGELAQLAHRLQAGATLATASTQHPDLFPAWLATLFRFGEKSGRMTDALDWAADELDREARASRAVTVALAYPVFLFTIIFALTTFSSLTTAPQFRSIYNSLNIMMNGTTFERDNPVPALAVRLFYELSEWTGVLAVFLLAWIGCIAAALFPRLPGHAAVHRGLRWLVPGVKAIDRSAHEALVARLMAAGLTAGMPLPELLDELAELPGDDHRALLRDAAARIRMGAAPAEAFSRAEGSPAAPFAMALAAALTGGQPEATLARIAAVSQARAADDLRRLPVAAGPVYTLVLGALGGFLALAQYSMLIKMIQVLVAY